VATALEEATGEHVELTRAQERFDPLNRGVVEKKRGHLEVDLAAASAVKVKKSQRELAAAIIALYDAAHASAQSANDRRRVFLDALLNLLRDW
jgi:hypothetical protein